jgi:cytoskeletal protein CcmA (bactofilin family)
MANKYFNVRQGLQTGNITLDATTGNANVGNLSTTDLNVAGNVNSNLIPNVASGVPSALTLGSPLQRFKDLYLSGNINLPGGQALTGNTTTASFSGNLNIPSALTSNIVNANTANVTGTLTANTINVDTIEVNTQFTLNSTINSTSTNTGSLTTVGGVGVKGNVTVGGAINLANFAVTGNVVRSSIYHDDTSNSISFKFN